MTSPALGAARAVSVVALCALPITAGAIAGADDDAADGQATASPAAPASPPLATEPTPYTVGKGRVAFEFSPFDLAVDSRNPDGENVRSTTWYWPVFMRYGLTDNVEFQIGAEALISTKTVDRDAGTSERTTDFGDILLRAKWNLIGNDGADDGDFSIALRPEIRLPTNGSDLGSRAVEGGVTIPMQLYLPLDLELSWAPAFEAVRDGDDDDYEFGFGSLVSLYGPFTDQIWWLVEFDSYVTTENGDPWQGAVNVGMNISVDDDLVVEFGTLFGVTKSADDVNVYMLVVKRF